MESIINCYLKRICVFLLGCAFVSQIFLWIIATWYLRDNHVPYISNLLMKDAVDRVESNFIIYRRLSTTTRPVFVDASSSPPIAPVETATLPQKPSMTNSLNASQNDPILIQFVANFHLFPSLLEPYNLQGSLVGNDGLAQLQEFIKDTLEIQRNGFFLECAAGDGETLSSTLWLEGNYKWQGLLIEPDPIKFKILDSKNRKAWISDACLSSTPYPDRIQMIKNRRTFATECYPLFTILSALSVQQVDFLSLKLDGAELHVLQNFPFSSGFVIKTISVPANDTTWPSLLSLLTSHGYTPLRQFFDDEIHRVVFVLKNYL